jgi:hypothetical protein
MNDKVEWIITILVFILIVLVFIAVRVGQL